ncbi:MAG: biotin transporter BioY [Chloroflexi bacterium]|nr:biotin transporter BioY [Chloroflexota bacterium]
MQLSARPLTLSRVVVPGQGILRDVALVVGFSLFTALSARISIPLPFTSVPITGQTLAVLLTGAVLGSRLGSLALLAYLAEGLAGLPVFANGASAWTISPVTGLPAIVGSSAGYLYAYPLAAFVVGYLAEHGWDRSVLRAGIAMLIGEVIIYAIGLPWLAISIAWSSVLQTLIPGATLLEKTLTGGLLPFIPGDLIKLVLAAAALPGAWALVRSRSKGQRQEG